MQFTTVLMVTLASSLTLARSVIPHATDPKITIKNELSHDIYFKEDAHSFDGEQQVVKANETTTIPFQTERSGNAIKFSKVSGDFTNVISFDYSVTHGETFYDISDGAGYPFNLKAVISNTASPSCLSVGCREGRCQSVKSCIADEHHQFEITAYPS